MTRLRTALLLLVLIGICVFLLRSQIYTISLSEFVLYQKFYPLSEALPDPEPGDFVFVDLSRREVVKRVQDPCQAFPSELIEDSDYIVSMKGSFDTDLMPNGLEEIEDGRIISTITKKSVAVVEFLDSMYKGKVDCESYIQSIIGNTCLLIIREVIYLREEKIGFGLSDKCQLVNSVSGINAIAIPDSFDQEMGIPWLTSIWVFYTFPFLDIEIDHR